MRLWILLLASTLAPAQSPDAAYEPLNKAYEALRTRRYDDAIALHCAALAFSRTGSGYTVGHANEQSLPAQGGTGGQPIPSTDCADNSVVIGTNVNYGAWLDLMGFLCSPVPVP